MITKITVPSGTLLETGHEQGQTTTVAFET